MLALWPYSTGCPLLSKEPCPLCERNLQILHGVNERPVIEASKTELSNIDIAPEQISQQQ